MLSVSHSLWQGSREAHCLRRDPGEKILKPSTAEGPTEPSQTLGPGLEVCAEQTHSCR